MRTVILTAVFALACAASARSDDADAKKIAALRDEIAKTEAKLDALKKQIISLNPDDAPFLRHEDFKVGIIGLWRKGEYALKVIEVIDKDSVYLAVAYRPEVNIVVKGIPTKGIVDGAKLPMLGLWEFTGTVKHAGKTVFVVQPLVRDEKK